jgi:hypothetical protein
MYLNGEPVIWILVEVYQLPFLFQIIEENLHIKFCSALEPRYTEVIKKYMVKHPCNKYSLISSNIILQRILLVVAFYGLQLETWKDTESTQHYTSMYYHKTLMGRNIS